MKTKEIKTAYSTLLANLASKKNHSFLIALDSLFTSALRYAKLQDQPKTVKPGVIDCVVWSSAEPPSDDISGDPVRGTALASWLNNVHSSSAPDTHLDDYDQLLQCGLCNEFALGRLYSYARLYVILRELPVEVPQLGLDVMLWEKKGTGRSVRKHELDRLLDAIAT